MTRSDAPAPPPRRCPCARTGAAPHRRPPARPRTDCAVAGRSRDPPSRRPSGSRSPSSRRGSRPPAQARSASSSSSRPARQLARTPRHNTCVIRSSLRRQLRAQLGKALGLLVAVLGEQSLPEKSRRGRQQRSLAHLLERRVAAAQDALAATGSPASISTVDASCETAVLRVRPSSSKVASLVASSSRASSKRPSMAWSPAIGWSTPALAAGFASTSARIASQRLMPSATFVGPKKSEEAIQPRISIRSCSALAFRAWSQPVPTPLRPRPPAPRSSAATRPDAALRTGRARRPPR